MTQQSYNNYVAIISCNISSYADDLVDNIKLDSCKAKEMKITLNILTSMLSILSCWELQTESDSEDDPHNCLCVDEMICISTFLNKILGLNFCVDFILT